MDKVVNTQIKQDKVESPNTPLRTGEIPSASKIKSKWAEGLQRRREVDKETWNNLAFLAGQHYSVWDPTTRRFAQPELNAGRVIRLKINLIKSLWRYELSQIATGKPQPEVLPVTAEDSSRMAAQAANRILEHELNRIGFENKKLQQVQWTTAAGLSYYHTYWDPEQENTCIDVIPHFEIVTDPACTWAAHEGNWIIHGKVMTGDEAYDKFGRDFSENSYNIPYSWGQLFAQGTTQIRPKKGVLVLRMWMKPCRKYPKGFVQTIVNDEVVETLEEFPFDHGELPFVDVHHIRLPGRYEGQSTIVDLIPVQRDYNQSRSRMAELRKVLTAPKIMSPKGALDVERITGTPGEILEYNMVGPLIPQWQSFPTVPNFLFSTSASAYGEMQDIAGSHNLPIGSHVSGAAIIAIQQRDQARLSPIMGHIEQQLAVVARQLLGLVKQYWTTQRAVRVWDEEVDSTGVHYFKGGDLEGEIDVRIVPGSATQESRQQQSQDILSLWDRKIVQDPRAVVKIMRLPSTDVILQQLSEDERQARREHDKIFEGQQNVVAEEWHNHQIHIQVHNDMRKGQSIESWPPELVSELADHVSQHEQFMQQQAQQAQQTELQQLINTQKEMAQAYMQVTGQPPAGIESLKPPKQQG